MADKLYITRNRKRWEAMISKDYDVLECGYQVIENGYILPLKKII